MFSLVYAPVWRDRVSLFTMRRELARGYVGALRKWQFSTMAKASNRCCLAMFSIISAKRLMNCRASVSDAGMLAFHRNALQFLIRIQHRRELRHSESANRANTVRAAKN